MAIIFAFRMEVSHSSYFSCFILNSNSAMVGVSLSAIALPLPGYLARVMNKIQTERMKKVLFASLFTVY